MGSFVTILLTAVLSSLFTLGLAVLVFHRYLKRRLESEMDRLHREWGATIEERVRRGVVEGVKSLPSTEVIRGARRTLTDTAMDLVRGGLDTLAGPSDDTES